MNRRHTLHAILALSLLGCSGKADDTADTDADTDTDTDTDDTAGTSEMVSIDCATVTKIGRDWGGTSGPCGPEYSLYVDNTGAVFTSASEAYPPEGEKDCLAVTTDSTIDTAEAEALLLTACEEFNGCEDFSDGAQVDGAWDAIGLFNGDELLVSTANITCEAGLPLTVAALDAIWDTATAEE